MYTLILVNVFCRQRPLFFKFWIPLLMWFLIHVYTHPSKYFLFNKGGCQRPLFIDISDSFAYVQPSLYIQLRSYVLLLLYLFCACHILHCV